MSKSSFLLDFKAFVMRGNVVDMAVGVIIGGAFGKIISSAGRRNQLLGTEMGIGTRQGS